MQVLLGATTLFFCCCRVAAFSSQDLVSGLRHTDAAPFFCCCRVAAFGSEDLARRTRTDTRMHATSDFIYKMGEFGTVRRRVQKLQAAFFFSIFFAFFGQKIITIAYNMKGCSSGHNKRTAILLLLTRL